jgi:predicted porin
VKFTGEATIVPGWSAGYVLHIEAINSDSLTQDQDTPSGPALYNVLGHGQGFAGGSFTGGNGVQVLQSYWFLKSDHLGKVSVGLQSQASDNTAILVDGSGSLVPANWVAFDTRSFFVRLKDGTLPLATSASRWGITQGCGNMGGVWGDCNGLTQDVVRYDSPSFGGFSVSASWGADDMWDVAARYAGEWGAFKVAAAAAYNEVNDGGPQPLGTGTYNGVGQVDSNYFQAGAYVEHIPTGLFLYGAYGHYHEDQVFTTVNGSADTYYVKGGIRQRWTPLGHTVVYGEYLRGNDGGGAIASGFNNLTPITDSELNVWGVGVVQEIDAAAMSVWVKYRDLSFDDNTTLNYDDFRYVGVGALINF